MRKYIKMLPVMLYPYAYIFILMGFIAYMNTHPGQEEAGIQGLYVIAVVYNVYSLVIVVINAVLTARNSNALQAATMNLVIKGIQIPAYLFHFGMGMFGSVLSIWGIGFVMWAIFIDMATILLTGISSIGCSILMYKEHLVSKRNAWLMGIGCFLFCIDIVIAVVYLVKSLTHKQIDS